MSERTSYAPGTPCWVDLATPDPAAAADFYRAVFGWERAVVDDPSAGGYGIFDLRGLGVAGVGPVMMPGTPPAWMVHVSVTDAGAAAARATAGGGGVLAGPMDVMTAGRMAVVQAPDGSVASAWQPGDTAGANLVNEPGAFVWNELSTSDVSEAAAFYSSVFGWETAPSEAGEGVVFHVAGGPVCGAHPAGPGEPTAWSIWFSTLDCDATTSRVAEHRGAVLSPPDDMGFGRGAVVADPQGAVFGIASVDPAERAP